MAWIEVHQALLTHRKTIAVAWELQLDPACIVGHMVCLWLWALDNAPSGDISQLDQRMVARIGAGYSGDSDAFMSAIESAGFIRRDNGKLVIHDWHVYAGRFLEKRIKLETLEAARAAEKATSRAGAPADVPAGDARDGRAPEPDTTVHNSTVQNRGTSRGRATSRAREAAAAATTHKRTKRRKDDADAAASDTTDEPYEPGPLCRRCHNAEAYESPIGKAEGDERYDGLCGACIIIQRQIDKGLRTESGELIAARGG